MTILRSLDALLFAPNPIKHKDKFLPRGVLCVFLGYLQNQKGYKLYNLLTHTTFVSRDVRFHEHVFPYRDDLLQKLIQPNPLTLPAGTSWFDDAYMFDHSPETPSSSPLTLHPPPPPDSPPQPDPPPQPVRSRRSARNISKPIWFSDYVSANASTKSQDVTYTSPHPIANPVSYNHLNPKFQSFISALITYTDPTTLKETITDSKWQSAMNLELRVLEDNET